jgi:hypothetical protein
MHDEEEQRTLYLQIHQRLFRGWSGLEGQQTKGYSSLLLGNEHFSFLQQILE